MPSIVRQSWLCIAVLAIPLVFATAPANAQQATTLQLAPGAAQTMRNRVMCVGEAERLGKSFLDQVERGAAEARDQLKAAAGKLQEALRGACMAVASLPADEALAAADKLANQVLQAAQALLAASDGGELTGEQKQALETLVRQLRLDELKEWMVQIARLGFGSATRVYEDALRAFDHALRQKKLCLAGLCIVPDAQERVEPPRGDQDGLRL